MRTGASPPARVHRLSPKHDPRQESPSPLKNPPSGHNSRNHGTNTGPEQPRAPTRGKLYAKVTYCVFNQDVQDVESKGAPKDEPDPQPSLPTIDPSRLIIIFRLTDCFDQSVGVDDGL